MSNKLKIVLAAVLVVMVGIAQHQIQSQGPTYFMGTTTAGYAIKTYGQGVSPGHDSTGDIVPGADTSYSLGRDDLRWYEVHTVWLYADSISATTSVVDTSKFQHNGTSIARDTLANLGVHNVVGDSVAVRYVGGRGLLWGLGDSALLSIKTFLGAAVADSIPATRGLVALVRAELSDSTQYAIGLISDSTQYVIGMLNDSLVEIRTEISDSTQYAIGLISDSTQYVIGTLNDSIALVRTENVNNWEYQFSAGAFVLPATDFPALEAIRFPTMPHDIHVLNYDSLGTDTASFSFTLPKVYPATSDTIYLDIWSYPLDDSAGSYKFFGGLRGVADGEVIDGAYSVTASVVDVSQGGGKEHLTTIKFPCAFAPDEEVYGYLNRDVGDASDDLNTDVLVKRARVRFDD